MSAQTPVGVISASKTVRRTIEVAVLPTLENCTLHSMRRANLHESFLQLEFPPLSPEKVVGVWLKLYCSCHNQWFELPSPPHGAWVFALATSKLLAGWRTALAFWIRIGFAFPPFLLLRRFRPQCATSQCPFLHQHEENRNQNQYVNR